eukprot:Skav225046  [mRNA]  locus=scaffold2061:401586:402445:+ [translate_table: standard]
MRSLEFTRDMGRLIWAAARGAICGESAKGSWVPRRARELPGATSRYLVDDRDGIWTVKQGESDRIESNGPTGDTSWQG